MLQYFTKWHQNWSGNQRCRIEDKHLELCYTHSWALGQVFDPRLMYTMTALRFSQDGNAALFSLQDTAFTIQHCSMAYGKYKCKAGCGPWACCFSKGVQKFHAFHIIFSTPPYPWRTKQKRWRHLNLHFFQSFLQVEIFSHSKCVGEALAKRDPVKALLNADSFAYYVMEAGAPNWVVRGDANPSETERCPRPPLEIWVSTQK